MNLKKGLNEKEEYMIPDPQDNMTVEDDSDEFNLDKNLEYPPSLMTLLFNLEAAMSHPSSALDHLKKLASDVEKVLQRMNLLELVFC
jgi:hypothetical protein